VGAPRNRSRVGEPRVADLEPAQPGAERGEPSAL
jgi:hypothetical protein